jgi:hypothetical protein
MGLEAVCRVESPVGAGAAKVLLETDSIIVRGSLRQTVPFTSITRIDVLGKRLVLTHDGVRTTLHLGPLAARWAEKIRSPRSRLDKLGVKPGLRVSVVGLEDPSFKSELAAAGCVLAWGRLRAASDLVFVGVETEAELARLEKAREAIDQDGAVWVIHPKGKDGLKDTAVFARARELGLVATKVAKFSETHTGERLVIPIAKRAGS